MMAMKTQNSISLPPGKQSMISTTATMARIRTTQRKIECKVRINEYILDVSLLGM